MSYKWNPEEYRISSSNQKRWGQELLSKIDFKGDEKVLDIGCGDGEITALIAQRVPKGFVVGIDSSKDMINMAKKNFLSKEYPNLSFLVKDVREITFEKEFDIVFSNACLHWVIDHLSVLKRIKTSLKPSGKIFFQMGGKGNAEEIIKVLENIIRQPKWSKFFKNFSFPYGFYSPKEYSKWLKIAGFKPKRIELLTKDMIHQDEKTFASWLLSTWLPYLQRIPENNREEFISEVIKRYLEKHPQDKNGCIHVQMVRLEVEAEIH
ncbi:Trans-aconitate 2-methyltransferase [Thermodesulfatator indicus DSM 15286]|uniref:Trans-aconitate 2-methyltransferase n=1 Tax=Thermodesulfatator indicus (strain DSM 15286 / JCM 11887 / CIR29812) TaxID=667014 RepID=F8A8U6_THEID|nr:methyltransferase domain-containing protein [Thermodesulfatator indicus]AEH43993.1 Trans-aconitate 2-methyltransferase [Thermodesulfatator indicus DSM 15286]